MKPKIGDLYLVTKSNVPTEFDSIKEVTHIEFNEVTLSCVNDLKGPRWFSLDMKHVFGSVEVVPICPAIKILFGKGE